MPASSTPATSARPADRAEPAASARPADRAEPAASSTPDGVWRSVAGLLLTGGRSSRMGVDKAELVLGGPGGRSLASTLAARLRAVTGPVLEVGPGHTDLTRAHGDPGEGPLVAIVTGWHALRDLGYAGPVIVLATDLPSVSETLLSWLAARPETGSVVPVAGGRPQPLCARWSAADLVAAGRLAAGGERSVMRALGPDTCYLGEEAWQEAATPGELDDADTPEDADRLGLRPPPPTASHKP